MISSRICSRGVRPAAGEVAHHRRVAVQIEQVIHVVFGELAQSQSRCFQDDMHAAIIQVRGGTTATEIAAQASAIRIAPRSLSDAAVDPFPQEVGVAAVAGVLLDHVDQYRAQRDCRAVPVDALDAEVGRIGDEFLRESDLVTPG